MKYMQRYMERFDNNVGMDLRWSVASENMRIEAAKIQQNSAKAVAL